MTPSLQFSTIIPWSNRPELAITLRENQAQLASFTSEIIVVNCGGDSRIVEQAVRQVPSLKLANLAVNAFNKSLALNLGASLAQGEFLFLLDADVKLTPHLLERMAAHTSRGSAFVTVERLTESEPAIETGGAVVEVAHSIELVLLDRRRISLDTNRIRYADGSRSAPGLLMVAREDFYRVGGMNSDLAGWGWEDLDLIIRLKAKGHLEQHFVGEAMHLSHGDDKRSFHSANGQDEVENFLVCLANYRLGHFDGTYEDDKNTWGNKIEIPA
ncbi:MAG TPA: glycosyltransferase family 2 protein [Candidatus Angelobacter sp.]|nr:glycosyltransferase family 2 protein [Candidatus Angelobacter sp.]